MRVTLARVNAALKEAGVPERLVRGKDYFYFAEGNSMKWPNSSVMVNRLNCLTIKEWVKERYVLAGEANPQPKAA